MSMTLEIDNNNNINKRTSSIILLCIFIIILILDVTISHIIFSVKWNWILYVLIFFLVVLSNTLYREKYIFIEITQEILSIKQSSYRNFPRKPVIELPIIKIEHIELEKIFFLCYLKIVIRDGDVKKGIKYHLKGFSNKKIRKIEEFLIEIK